MLVVRGWLELVAGCPARSSWRSELTLELSGRHLEQALAIRTTVGQPMGEFWNFSLSLGLFDLIIVFWELRPSNSVKELKLQTLK
jgi:hypothetical protein